MIGVELYTVGARLEMSLENGYFYDTSMKMKSLGLLFEIFCRWFFYFVLPYLRLQDKIVKRGLVFKM